MSHSVSDSHVFQLHFYFQRLRMRWCIWSCQEESVAKAEVVFHSSSPLEQTIQSIQTVENQQNSLFMAYVTDGSVQWDHITGHHVEAKLFDGSLDGVFVLWTQDKRLSSLSRTARDPLRLRFFGLKVSQDTFLEDRAGVGMSVGLECHILLLDHLLLVGLLLRVLGVGIRP